MIPDKLANFMCYEENNDRLLGVADVTLPEIAYMTDTLKGAGISGEIDMPVIGHTQSLSMTLNFKSIMDTNIRFIGNKVRSFDFRGSVQAFDEIKSELTTKAVRVTIRGLTKKGSLGKFDVGTSMDTNTEFEVMYIKIFIEEQDYLEIDKMNFICIIDGIDYLEKVRRDIGLD